MEESKMENIQDSMKYYCRVCTTNTKSKKSKSDECIGIFKKTGLKSTLEKYLQLQISEDDPLPKVICKVCFDKIEAIEFLRVIARRTETLLRDFLRNKESQGKSHSQFQNAYNSFAISKTTPRVPPKDDEVVVNVSSSDPLTKDINKKLLVAQRKKESLEKLEKSFNPVQISRSAVTSSPNVTAPLTIVHQMPRKKLPTVPNLMEKRKKLQMALTNATTVTLENPPPVPAALPIKLPMRPKCEASAPPPLRHISEAPAIPQKVEIHPVITENTHTLGHGVSLGSIIKDEDLLRLILKALKWPYNNQTLDIQIQRLKNTNFSDVIVDPNLLQDADLIQILGPLIHPTLVPLPLGSQQQSFCVNIPPETIILPPSTISYKLPAETSVQIITVPPEEKPTMPKLLPQKPSTSHPRSVLRKKPRFAPYTPKPVTNNIIVVSDDSEDDSLKGLTEVEDVQRFEVQLDPAMYPGIGDNSNSNETMLATLNRQREAMMRMHRIKRKQSLVPSNVEMVDDIMIVDEGIQMNESFPEVVLVKKPRKPSIMTSAASTSYTKPMPITITATSTPSKTITSTISAVEPPKRLPMQPTPQQPPPPPTPAPAPLQKLPTLPVKKLPTLLNLKKPTPTTSPILTKLPLKKDVLIRHKPMSALHNYFNNTTLADADSTTKIVIKESKVPKPQTASTDIEEQIIKVRIGKQTQKTEATQTGAKNKTGEPSSEEEEVVIVVEYEDTNEEQEKQTDNTNGEKNASKEVIASPDHRQEDIVNPEVTEKDVEPERQVEAEASRKNNEFELPAIEIKEEDDQDIDDNKEDEVSAIKEEKSTKSDEKGESATESPKPTQRSFVASKTSTSRLTRSTKKHKRQPKKVDAKPIVSTTFRPARRSKTLSKYYKGPPASGPSGRSMRSRT